MQITRRTFLAGLAAATAAAAVPRTPALAATGPGAVATLVDLSLCDGCPQQATPACVLACREKNTGRFPEPDPAMLKDYWPQKYHEDWSAQRELTGRLTPYNWTFVQKVRVEHEGTPSEVAIPRRCMHCHNPPCVKLCPFGSAKQEKSGATYIDERSCLGGAKCRTVCPWSVPQRQAGVGLYTDLDPLPLGGGVMYKCDFCRDRLAAGKAPACIAACPRQAMTSGPRLAVEELARKRAEEIGGHLYGLTEHGGTSTIYVSAIPFAKLDAALVAAEGEKAMRLHAPANQVEKSSALARMALLAPLAGAIGAFAATAGKRKEKDDE